jgi:hypothetical protein
LKFASVLPSPKEGGDAGESGDVREEEKPADVS